MKQLLLILSLLPVCGTTQAQRYRLVNTTDYTYSIKEQQYEVRSFDKYSYFNGSDRGSNYAADTVMYDTLREYIRINDTIRATGKTIKRYNSTGRLDTVIYYWADSLNVVASYDVYRYNNKGLVVCIDEYRELFYDEPTNKDGKMPLPISILENGDTLFDDVIDDAPFRYIYKPGNREDRGWQVAEKDSFLYSNGVLQKNITYDLFLHSISHIRNLYGAKGALLDNVSSVVDYKNGKPLKQVIRNQKELYSNDIDKEWTRYYFNDDFGLVASYYTMKLTKDDELKMCDTAYGFLKDGRTEKEFYMGESEGQYIWIYCQYNEQGKLRSKRYVEFRDDFEESLSVYDISLLLDKRIKNGDTYGSWDRLWTYKYNRFGYLIEQRYYEYPYIEVDGMRKPQNKTIYTYEQY